MTELSIDLKYSHGEAEQEFRIGGKDQFKCIVTKYKIGWWEIDFSNMYMFQGETFECLCFGHVFQG